MSLILLVKVVRRKMKMAGIWLLKHHLWHIGNSSLRWICFLFPGGNTASVNRRKVWMACFSQSILLSEIYLCMLTIAISEKREM